MSTTHTRIPPVEITGPYGAMVKLVSRKLFGRTPDSVRVLWNQKAVMKVSMGLGQKVDGWKELDPNLASYAAIASAATIGCSFCLDFNYFMAHNHGLDIDKVRQVPNWREATVFTPLERQVMEYAEAASLTPPAVTDELSDALLAQLGAAALVELAGRVAFMNMTARMNIALGIHSEQFADDCGLAPLEVRQASGTAA